MIVTVLYYVALGAGALTCLFLTAVAVGGILSCVASAYAAAAVEKSERKGS